MAYKLLDINGHEIHQADLQNKGLWCELGASKEEVFVEKYGASLGLQINPEKEQNPYVPDLVSTVTGRLGDLKTQNTPFFQARARFNLDPQHTVVFNGKDYSRYASKYPNIDIYFAVDWQAVAFIGKSRIEVQPMVGVWHIPFETLSEIIPSCDFHSYQQRTNDQKGNAKGSYILDLTRPEFKKVT